MQEMVKCAGCGAMVPPQKAFCPNCGAAMGEEEMTREKKGIENMAQTVIGVSLNDLGKTQILSKPPVPEAKPPVTPPVESAKPVPPPVVNKDERVAVGANNSSGNSKIALIVIAGIVILFVLLALLAGVLVMTGIIPLGFAQ
jgi:hypothetical protein